MTNMRNLQLQLTRMNRFHIGQNLYFAKIKNITLDEIAKKIMSHPIPPQKNNEIS